MTERPRLFTVGDAAEMRLDQFLAAQLGISRSKVQKYIVDGFVLVNGKQMTAHVRLRADDRVSIAVPEETQEERLPAPEPSVIAETAEYLILEKPAGLLVHPAPGRKESTLVDWLVEHYPEIRIVGDLARPGIVHRLDRDVSGVMAVARTSAMFDHLKKEFHERRVVKVYTALVIGAPANDEGVIRFRLARSASGSGKIAARPEHGDGKDALTKYAVQRRFTTTTLLSVRILTGRTHQIRAHLFGLGFPVVGDTLYHPKKLPHLRDLHRLFLHATRIGFTGDAGTWVEYTSPLPPDLEEYLGELKLTHSLR